MTKIKKIKSWKKRSLVTDVLENERHFRQPDFCAKQVVMVVL